MYQAIQVKYLGPTNTKGSRWKATAAAGSVTVSYDHALSSEKNAEAAMLALVKKFGWGEHPATWQGGVLPNGDYVFVRLPAVVGNCNLAMLEAAARRVDKAIYWRTGATEGGAKND